MYHLFADLCSKTAYCESALCSHMMNSFRSMVLDFLIFVTVSRRNEQWSNLFVVKVQAQKVKESYLKQFLDISKCIHALFQAKVKVKQDTFSGSFKLQYVPYFVRFRVYVVVDQTMKLLKSRDFHDSVSHLDNNDTRLQNFQNLNVTKL